MSSLARVRGSRVALVWALLAFACQGQGDALFDNSNLGASSIGGTSAASAGASRGGGNNTGATGTGGKSSSEAGGSGSGAKAAGGNGANGEGPAGSSAGGSGGNGDEGGSADSGGTKSEPEPEPATIELTVFEDTYVSSCGDYTNFGDAEELRVDAAASSDCVYQSLLRVGLEPIPAGALVSRATLTLTCIDAGGLMAVAHAAEAWAEDSVRWNNRPELGDAVGSLTCDTAGGTVTLELKATLAAWLTGELANYGLYFRSEDENGTDLVSSEGAEASGRPALSVTYTLPIE